MKSLINMPKLIAIKRDGGALSNAQIRNFIQAYSRDDIPEYQASAMLMAIYLQGMNETETVALTEEMVSSGQTLAWPSNQSPIVDKHSTGGVGDKTSLIIAPLLASVGCTVPMISGRGLGATGGTLDKLESIPGFQTQLDESALRKIIQQTRCVMVGATESIAPADRKLYALRDVTATVASIPLITASILSKKLAEGLDALILDVKWGSGAFMRKQKDARELARSLVRVGNRLGVKTRALLTDMNQPLGRCAGNAIEVNECLDVLGGRGPEDLKELSLQLASHAWSMVRQDENQFAAYEELKNKLSAGEALSIWNELVAAQGGSLREPLPVYQPQPLTSSRGGFVTSIDTQAIGEAIVALGGGRRELDDVLDPAAGVTMQVRLGDSVQVGDPLLWVHAPNDENRRAEATDLLRHAVQVSDNCPPPLPLIVEVIDSDECER